MFLDFCFIGDLFSNVYMIGKRYIGGMRKDIVIFGEIYVYVERVVK